MAGSLLYTIKSGSGFALSIDGNNFGPGGQLILANVKPSDPDQLWTWVYYPGTQASILYNSNRDLFAAPETLSKGAKVVLFKPQPSSFTGATTWQVISGESNNAVRPPDNTDLNLNALGDDNRPGTPVGLWDWSGGKGNEVWTSTFATL